ncbi:MAG TPA: trypsin-like peptidase domain-containing protein [Oligoflexia bacterium]|nr:trypsin-like peptidase domain-containing protein [Oligoflexia bacterium]HMP48841.1 trypsin-like peptidase domain-containing protein [Oligoflexia bacterium]
MNKFICFKDLQELKLFQFSSLLLTGLTIFLVNFFSLSCYSLAFASPDSDSFTNTSRKSGTLRTESEQIVINLYKKANKAVVNLSTQTIAQDFFYPVFQEGSGSGVIIDSKYGLLVTNFHVIKGASKVQATLASGKSYDVELVGEDADNELALLRIINPPNDLTELPLGDSNSLEVGQTVLAIGNPFGLNRTLTRGIISSLGRSIRSDRGTLIEDVIQTDAAINPGNSGGPLINMSGEVIGLNTAILSKTGSYAGIGFAIPSSYIKKVLPQLLKYGKVLRPKIGVIFENTEAGAVVFLVQPGSPASKAGLQGAQKVIRNGPFIRYYIDISNADFVLEINGQKINNKDEAVSAIMKSDPGLPIEILIRRGASAKSTKKILISPILD